MKKKIFIAWSGKLGQKLADKLKETIFSHPELDTSLSTDIKAGEPWFTDIEKKLTEAEVGIGCISPGTSIKPWMNFEAGYIFGRLRNFKLLLLGEDELSGPLQFIQAVNGNKKEDLIKLLGEIIGKEPAENWIKFTFPAWDGELAKLKKQIELETELEKTLRPVFEAGSLLKNVELVRENTCLQLIIQKSIREMSEQIKSVPTSNYFVPASQYPYYLVSLQKDISARVDAVALVDQFESFWQQEIGKEILKHSKKENRRVFVFLSESDFNRCSGLIQQHSKEYKVYVISYQKLLSEFPIYAKDFAIIEANASKVLASYDRESIQKTICYSTNAKEINKHEEAFENILGAAKEISRDCKSEELDEIKEQLFSLLTRYDSKSIEMSSYISVDDYDEHEEKHAYYVEMMQRMISIFQKHSEQHNFKDYRLLELGAGTGIFTKRLAEQHFGEIVALEIDWVCFKKLLYNLQEKYSQIKFLNEDSRIHNPYGKFKYIFSSFSDHHIKSNDKLQYFKNIKKNLENDSLFIVGDEFLPDYMINDENQYEQALKAYHQHIIDIAESEGHYILAKLEKDALKSGLEKRGDFKVSCAEYENLLTRVGLNFKKEKIGPIDNESVGGVYVYTINLR